MSIERTSFTSISIRVTPQERDQLDQLAGNCTVSAYVRERVLGKEAAPRKTQHRNPIKDQELISRVLSMLGASRIASNLNQLAKAVNLGILTLPPELESLLREACLAVLQMRDMLMQSLGKRGGDDI
jgi:hypothetical protein